ncbi:hypothetical protein [Ekhidna sp. To15]|uniref:hypothetical protein n=1 Tax=Ekhidna sp. To15 TaxID=3395267 RepID=UPI003F51DA93
MQYLKLALFTIISLILITLLVEMIEFSLVALVNGQSFSDLPQEQEAYFCLRNQPSILIAKPIYTFIIVLLVSYLCSKLLKHLKKSYFIALSIVQSIGIIYGAFLSEFKNSLPLWYWMVLLLVILAAFRVAYIKRRKQPQIQ